MPSDEPTPIRGQQDPKPYKVERVDSNGLFVARVGSYVTEQEARANMKRSDWHYSLYHGNRRVRLGAGNAEPVAHVGVRHGGVRIIS